MKTVCNNNMILLQIILLVVGVVCNVKSANILAITGVVSPSHHIWNRAIMIALAEKGHNVTYIGPDKEKTITPNLTGIHMEGIYEDLHQDINIMKYVNMKPMDAWAGFFEYGYTQCKVELKSESLKTLQNYPRDLFDLIILDTFGGECFYPLIDYFGSPPVIAVSPYGLLPWISYYTGDYEYPALIPTAGHMTNRMNLSDRFWNFIYSHFITYFYKYQYIPMMEELIREYYGDEIKPILEGNKRIGIYLANTHPVVDYPRPIVPAVIPVGGLHIKPAGPIIHKNIKQFLDSANNGFVLFSLGTNVRSENLGKEKIDAILNALKQIPHKVLWKFESDSLPGKPNNVMIQKWLPDQGNILSHPNARLFITHGGYLSTQEAVFHGVPIVGIPFYCDQNMNIEKMVERGYGLKVDFMSLTANELQKSIKEVLNNPKYKENIKRASAQFKDQPETPLERAVFWTEHVLRHGGAQHLQPSSVDMAAYQAYSLDVLALLLAIGITIVIVPACLCRYLFYKKKIVKKNKIN